MSPSVHAELHNFGPGFAQTTSIACSRADLFHAALTTGLGVSPFSGVRGFSYSEAAWKLPLVAAMLHENGSAWVRPPDSDWLDPSEKAAISYLLGNVQTGLFATKLLGATHVAHLALLDPHVYARAAGGRMLPDFAAVNLVSRQTFVIETKSSLSRVSSRQIARGKKQLSNRVRFRAYPPPFRYVHTSEFVDYSWTSRMFRESGRAPSIPLSLGAALYWYYKPILDLIRVSGSSAEGEYLAATVGGVRIAISEWIVDSIDSVSIDVSAPRPDEIVGARVALRYDEIERVAREVALANGEGGATTSDSVAFPDGIRVSV